MSAHVTTTGDLAHASTTGDWAHASTTGYRANASTTGDGAHASTTGDWAHASTTGVRAHASTTGDRANASTTGYGAHASTTGVRANASTTGVRANASTTGYGAHASTTGVRANASTTGFWANASTTGFWAHALSAQGTASSAHAVAVGRWVRLLPGSCDALVLPDDPDKHHPMLISADDGWCVGRWVTMTDGMVEEWPDVLLPDDGRNYQLVFRGGRYEAGCRRFTADQAIAHWSNPDHEAPTSAALLLAAVRAHIAGEFDGVFS